jgi:hypothetical protein
MAFTPASIRRRFIQAGVEETTKGVQTAAFLDILANVGATVQATSNYISRDVISADFGSFGGVHTSKVWQTSLNFENKGGGVADPTPEINPILQCCALAYSAEFVLPITVASGDFTLGETVTSDDATPATARVLAQNATMLFVDNVTNTFGASAALTSPSATTATMNGSPIASAVYTQVSDYASMKTASIKDVRENDQRTGLFTMGTAVFDFAVDSIPVVNTTLTSLYQTPIAAVATAGAVSTVNPDPWIGATFEINGVACGDYAVSAFSLDVANTVSQVKAACAGDGIAAIIITDSQPMLTVTMTKPLLSAFDPFTLMEDNTKFDVFTTHGTGAGERMRVGVPNGQITAISEGETDGVETYTLTISATKAGGVDVPKFHVIYY